jgi:hypothetical protein
MYIAVKNVRADLGYLFDRNAYCIPLQKHRANNRHLGF